MKQNERIMGDYSQNELETLLLIEQMFSDLCKENIKQKAKSVMDKLDSDYPLSSIMNIVQIVYTLFVIRQLDFSEFINFLKEIEIIEENNKFNINNIFNIFSHFIIKEYTQESYYLIENMIEEKLLESKLIKNIQNSYFAHYMTEKQIKEKHFLRFMKKIIENYEELSKNDWELHKKLIKEGVNPNELAIIIRNDDIEKLQEISSQTKFDYNQTIEPSLYERCDFINKDNVTLIDYAAFFGSIKCFKYLLMNEANIEETGKYAVAGGNEEIIHLCEQNHSTFEDAYETAIDFHRNDIFKYLYENKIVENYNLEELGKKCVSHYNYKILSFLIKEGMKINVNIIDESARIGNIFLIKYFHKDNQLPLDILISSSISGNIELVKYILDQKDININANDINLFYFMFVPII